MNLTDDNDHHSIPSEILQSLTDELINSIAVEKNNDILHHINISTVANTYLPCDHQFAKVLCKSLLQLLHDQKAETGFDIIMWYQALAMIGCEDVILENKKSVPIQNLYWEWQKNPKASTFTGIRSSNLFSHYCAQMYQNKMIELTNKEKLRLLVYINSILDILRQLHDARKDHLSYISQALMAASNFTLLENPDLAEGTLEMALKLFPRCRPDDYVTYLLDVCKIGINIEIIKPFYPDISNEIIAHIRPYLFNTFEDGYDLSSTPAAKYLRIAALVSMLPQAQIELIRNEFEQDYK